MGRPILYAGGGRKNYTRPQTNQTKAGGMVSKPGLGNSLPGAIFQNSYGQSSSVFQDKGLPKPLEIKDIYEDTEVQYPALQHRGFGYFNGGFPFLLPAASDYLSPPENEISINGAVINTPNRRKGISKQYNTGVFVDNKNPGLGHLGGGFPIKINSTGGSGYYGGGYDYDAKIVAVNNFFNLACVEADFVIRTKSCPEGYTTGYCYNSDDSSEDGLQYVSQDWEVVNSYDETAFVPHLREYPDPTGVTHSISLFSNGLMDGTGLNYSSIHFLGDDIGNQADFFVPITIQPDNTGAFVITLDEGVADFFASRNSYGDKQPFNCNMMFDFQIMQRDHEGFERSTVDYHIFPTKGFVVPALDWDFEIVSSKIKGVYYSYPFREDARYPGDNASSIDTRLPAGDSASVYPYSLTTSPLHGSHQIRYNNVDFTHTPFEVRPNYLDNYYGTYYELGESVTYLNPVEKSLSAEELSDNTYRQVFQQGTNTYSTEGSNNVSRTFRALERPKPNLSSSSILAHYEPKDRLDIVSQQADSTKFMASVFCKTPYRFGSSNNSPFFSPSLEEGENPYKKRKPTNREIPLAACGVNRRIPQKTRDLTFQRPEWRKLGSVGAKEDLVVPYDSVRAREASFYKGSLPKKEIQDDRLLRGYKGSNASLPKPTFRVLNTSA